MEARLFWIRVRDYIHVRRLRALTRSPVGAYNVGSIEFDNDPEFATNLKSQNGAQPTRSEMKGVPYLHLPEDLRSYATRFPTAKVIVLAHSTSDLLS